MGCGGKDGMVVKRKVFGGRHVHSMRTFFGKWPQFTTVTVCGVLARRMAQPMRLLSALLRLIVDKVLVLDESG